MSRFPTFDNGLSANHSVLNHSILTVQVAEQFMPQIRKQTFTEVQVQKMIRDALKEQQERLQDEYDRVLHELLKGLCHRCAAIQSG